MEAQARVVRALCVLYNILCDLGEEDGEIPENEEERSEGEPEDGEDLVQGPHIRGQREYNITAEEKERASNRRNGIANAMWQEFSSQRRQI